MTVRRVIVNVGTVLLVLGCLGAAGLVIAGWRVVPVLSGSMRPTLQTGDAVFTRPADASTLHPGDVLVYSAPIDGRPLVLHRLVDIRTEGSDVIFHTKGDANEAVDAWTTRMPAEEEVMIPFADVPHLGQFSHNVAAFGRERGAMTVGIVLLTGYLLFRLWGGRPHARSAHTADLPSQSRAGADAASTTDSSRPGR